MRQGPVAGLVQSDDAALGSLKSGYFWAAQKTSIAQKRYVKDILIPPCFT